MTASYSFSISSGSTEACLCLDSEKEGGWEEELVENTPSTVQCLFNIFKALGSIPSTIKMKNKTKRELLGRQFSGSASRTESHHSGDSSSYTSLLLHGKEAGSTFLHHRLSCKHTELKKLTPLLAALLQGAHLTDSI